MEMIFSFFLLLLMGRDYCNRVSSTANRSFFKVILKIAGGDGGVISVSISDNIINEVRSLQTIYSPVVIGRGLSSLTGRGVISVSISGNIINEVRSLQTIYSPVVIGRGLSSLTGRRVISVSISDNIINEVRSLQTIYSPVVAGRVRNQRLSRTSFKAWWQPQPVPLRQERCLVSGESVRWGPRGSWSASTNTSTSSTFREPGDNQL